MSVTDQKYNTIEDINRDPLKAPVNIKKKRKMNRMLNMYLFVGFVLMLVANFVVASPLLLPLIYKYIPHASGNELKSLSAGSERDKSDYIELVEVGYEKPTLDVEIPELPPIDDTLPMTNSIKISKIGVNTELISGNDIEAALDKGVWIVNDFGKPDDPFAPIIIASHRWGGINWSQEKRSVASFYRLPETQVGDRIEVIWRKRIYVYEIYSGEENTKITDYNADLILYTCKVLWESPDRIFRYAKRIETESI